VPGSIASGLLLVELLLHVGHLLGDDAVIGGDTVELGHDVASLLNTAVTVGEARGLGQEQSTNTQNQRPGKANAHRDAPRGSGVDALSTEVDNVGDEDAKGHEQLESADHGTTDLTGSRLGLVHGDDTGKSTDTQTGDPTTDGNLVPFVGGGDLHNDTDDVEEGPEGNGELAADSVGNGGSHKGTNHGTNGQKTDNKTIADVAEDVFTRSGIVLGEPHLEIGHSSETRDLTCVEQSVSTLANRPVVEPYQ